LAPVPQTLINRFFLSLRSYHLYIVAIGETTFERVKRMYATQRNPHDRGVCGNYAQLCCDRAPDSLLPDLSEEITYEQYLKENVEPEKLSQILYGAGYGSAVTGEQDSLVRGGTNSFLCISLLLFVFYRSFSQNAGRDGGRMTRYFFNPAALLANFLPVFSDYQL
jgi:hypothetical protein